MQVIFDLEQNPERPEPADWHPQPFPSTLTVTAGSIRDAAGPLQLLRMPSRVTQQGADAPRRGRGRRQGTPALGPPDPRARAGTADAGQHERPARSQPPVGWANATMSEVKRIRAGLGGTVNDVILTAITRGYRDLLEGRGELVPDMVVRSLVPVSTRGGRPGAGQQPSDERRRRPAGRNRRPGPAARAHPSPDGPQQARHGCRRRGRDRRGWRTSQLRPCWPSAPGRCPWCRTGSLRPGRRTCPVHACRCTCWAAN